MKPAFALALITIGGILGYEVFMGHAADLINVFRNTSSNNSNNNANNSTPTNQTSNLTKLPTGAILDNTTGIVTLPNGRKVM